MSTQTSVWVLIITESVSDKIKNLVDSGSFAEAKDLDFNIQSLTQKVNALINEKGGSVSLSIYDRQVLELPITVAEELPLILVGYRQVFGSMMSVGIGLDLREASLAAQKSSLSNDIEMYDPKDESYQGLSKTLEIEEEMFQPQPNLYDKGYPKPPAPDADATNVGKYRPSPNAQQQMQSENEIVQATVQQLMGPANEMQQQAQQQQQQQQPGQGPTSILESLSGEKKPDAPKTNSKQKKADKNDDSDNDDDSSDDDSDDSAEEESSDKIGKLLSSVQEKLPQLMQLHDKNPEAFKKIVGLVHKLVDMAKKKKDVKKTEVSNLTEDLNKMIKLRFPVGTIRNRKKKVIVNGKATWRSVISGQVQDLAGNAVSVQSHNAKAKDGDSGAAE